MRLTAHCRRPSDRRRLAPMASRSLPPPAACLRLVIPTGTCIGTPKYVAAGGGVTPEVFQMAIARHLRAVAELSRRQDGRRSGRASGRPGVDATPGRLPAAYRPPLTLTPPSRLTHDHPPSLVPVSVSPSPSPVDSSLPEHTEAAAIRKHGTCIRGGMEPMELARPLALAGLMVGTLGYYMLIRLRRARRDDDEARRFADSRQRTVARFRRLNRRDDA